MQARNGSWGTKMRNNIFINDQANSIEIYDTSIYRLDASFNVADVVSYHTSAGDDHVKEMPSSLKSLAIQLPEGPNTISGITQERAAKEFVRYGNEPWVVIEGKWWRRQLGSPETSGHAPTPNSLPTGATPTRVLRVTSLETSAAALPLAPSHLLLVTRNEKRPRGRSIDGFSFARGIGF